MVTEIITEMIDILNQAMLDANKFENGNATAGTRVRKYMQDIKRLAQDVRNGVTEAKNENKK